MGYPDADLAKYKSRLAGKIAEAIERRGLTQKQAAATLGVDQPRVSHLVRGQLAGFSSDTLLAFLKKLDYEVTIAIHDRRAAVDEQESIAV
ncbi:MAG: XRE family transcriptional regulator [Chloroflexi bacterium]|nr:XRE family transcriptional regulator [Chloroflexota bacterium]